NTIDYDMFSGGRVELGLFLDEHNHVSLETAVMILAPQHTQFERASDSGGNPVIARPVFNALLGTEEAFIVAFPSSAVGASVVESSSELYGGEINARCHGCFCEKLHADALLGFRFLRFAETLSIRDRLTPLRGNQFRFLGNFIPVGDTVTDEDR